MCVGDALIVPGGAGVVVPRPLAEPAGSVTGVLDVRVGVEHVEAAIVAVGDSRAGPLIRIPRDGVDDGIAPGPIHYRDRVGVVLDGRVVDSHFTQPVRGGG